MYDNVNLNTTELQIKTTLAYYDLDYEAEKITKRQALKECNKFINALKEIFVR